MIELVTFSVAELPYILDDRTALLPSIGSETDREICTSCPVHQVTWVEHVEVDDRSVHNIYKQLVNSGLAFGARRWVGTLDRQCERLASVMSSNIPTSDIGGKLLVP